MVVRSVGLIIYLALLFFSGLVLLEGDTFIYFEEELVGALFVINILVAIAGWVLSKKHPEDKLIKKGIYISLGNILVILAYLILFGTRISFNV